MSDIPIQDRTVTIKVIFEDLLGKENAKIVLTKIQEAYDKGLRGEALKKVAKDAIKDIPHLTFDAERIVVATIAIIII